MTVSCREASQLFVLDGRARPIIFKIHYAVFALSCSHWIYPRWLCGQDATGQGCARLVTIQFTRAIFSFAFRCPPLGISASSFRNRLRALYNWDFEFPTEYPKIEAISLCSYPWTS